MEYDGIVLGPDTISSQIVEKLCSAVEMDATIDGDGDLVIEDGYRFYVRPVNEGRYIRMFTAFRKHPDSTLGQRLMYANNVNDEIVGIRAYVTESGGIGFDYYLLMEGGILPLNLIFAVKRFSDLLRVAVNVDGSKTALG